jgi:hypothetical protein
MRLTAACPEALMDDANHLMMALGLSTGDGETFAAPIWRDGNGALYAAASFMAGESWVHRAQAALDRPAWDVVGLIDMDAAARAQAALAFVRAGGDAQAARAGVLVLAEGDRGPASLAAMGVALVTLDAPEPEPEPLAMEAAEAAPDAVNDAARKELEVELVAMLARVTEIEALLDGWEE